MEYKLGICDQDYHYVVNLMEYVNSRRIGGVSLVAFSSLEAVTEYLGNNYLDGVLVGQDVNTDGGLDKIQSELIIIPLTTNRNLLEDGIFKYQNVSLIVQAMLERLNVSLSPEPVSDRSFFAIYSPLGRCGKTTLAKGLGIKLKNSLYIGLEEFGSRESLGEEILYHIIIQSVKVHELIDRVRPNQFGLREVKGILSYMDIRQLSRSNMIWLKEQLLLGGEYENVIFDIGGAVLSDLDLLDVMDRIYVPVLPEKESQDKLQAFRELLRCEGYKNLGKKLQYVNVPICHYASEIMSEFISKGEL